MGCSAGTHGRPGQRWPGSPPQGAPRQPAPAHFFGASFGAGVSLESFLLRRRLQLAVGLLLAFLGDDPLAFGLGLARRLVQPLAGRRGLRRGLRRRRCRGLLVLGERIVAQRQQRHDGRRHAQNAQFVHDIIPPPDRWMHRTRNGKGLQINRSPSRRFGPK